MEWQDGLSVVPTFGGAAITAAIAVYSLWHRNVRGAAQLAWLMLAITEWSLASGLAKVSQSPEAAVFWTKATFLGIASMPVAGLAFFLHYTGRGSWLTWRRLAILSAVPSVTQVVIWTNDAHGLFARWYTFTPEGATAPMDGWVFGPWFWVHFAYSYALLLVGTALLILTAIRSPEPYRGQAVTLLLWSIVTLTISVPETLGWFEDLSLMPLVPALNGLAFAWGVFRYRLLDLVPIARDVLIDSTSDGMIVLDLHDRIVDVNPAALGLLGLTSKDAVGKPAGPVLRGWPELAAHARESRGAPAEIAIAGSGTTRHFNARVSPLTNERGRPIGRMIVLHDITALKRVEAALKRAHGELEDRVVERTAELARAVDDLNREIAERRRAEGEARLLQTIVLAIAEAEDLHAALGVTLRLVCEATGWAIGEAWTPGADRTRLEPGPAWHAATPGLESFRQASAGFTFTPGIGLPGRVWASCQPAWIRDAGQDSSFSRAALAREAGLRAAMGIPVLEGNELIAVMDFLVVEPRDEDDRQIRLISAIAAQVGTVIRRKRAENEVRALNVTLEQRVAGRTRELTALYEVSAVASRALTLQAMLAEALAQTASALQAEAGAVFLVDEVDEPSRPAEAAPLRLSAHLGIPVTALAGMQTVPADSPWLGAVIAQRDPLLVPNTRADARLPREMREAGTLTLMLAPMQAEGQVLGVLGVAREYGRGFALEEMALLSSIADQLGVAVQNDRRRQRATVLEERQRLARDLHDSATQSLYGLVALAEAGQATLEAGTPDGIGGMLARMGQTARRALREMRLFIHEMQPPELEREGLAGALHFRLAAVEGRSRVTARLVADEDLRLSPAVEKALYHIAQEALNNCLRHADANTVTVRLRRDGGTVVLEIDDDGQGFDPERLDDGGAGLRNMRERAAQAGGRLRITSRPGAGTQVAVRVAREG